MEPRNRWQNINAVMTHPRYGAIQCIHVVPIEGPRHVLAPDCWCEPQLDDEQPIWVLVHKDTH